MKLEPFFYSSSSEDIVCSIVNFNDNIATSQAEVEDKLMEIAKDLRNQGK